jgi:hypothetical protein
MYKNLSIAVLLVAFGLVAARSTGTPPSAPTSPEIVARGRLVNQTLPISAQTIFTPTQSGFYRLSVYATLTTRDSNSRSSWAYTFQWTDDAGAEIVGDILSQSGAGSGDFFDITQNSPGGAGIGGTVRTFAVKGGTEVTQTMSQIGSPDNSAYSLYWVLERLQ